MKLQSQKFRLSLRQVGFKDQKPPPKKPQSTVSMSTSSRTLGDSCRSAPHQHPPFRQPPRSSTFTTILNLQLVSLSESSLRLAGVEDGLGVESRLSAADCGAALITAPGRTLTERARLRCAAHPVTPLQDSLTGGDASNVPPLRRRMSFKRSRQVPGKS